jgi:hypothetical protein
VGAKEKGKGKIKQILGMRERDNLGGGRAVRETTKLWGGGSEIAVAVWKVPRHCPLVLLIGWDLTLALNTTI